MVTQLCTLKLAKCFSIVLLGSAQKLSMGKQGQRCENVKFPGMKGEKGRRLFSRKS